VQQLDRPAAEPGLGGVVDAAAVGVIELASGDRATVGLEPDGPDVVLQLRVDRFGGPARHPHLTEAEAWAEFRAFEDRGQVERRLAEAAGFEGRGGRRVRSV